MTIERFDEEEVKPEIKKRVKSKFMEIEETVCSIEGKTKQGINPIKFFVCKRQN